MYAKSVFYKGKLLNFIIKNVNIKGNQLGSV